MEHGSAVTPAVLRADLDRHRYLSLTTYRRDGRGVATPVRKYPMAKPAFTLLWKVATLFGRQQPGRELFLAIAPAGR